MTIHIDSFLKAWRNFDDTVKPVLSSYSKIYKTKVLKTNGSLNAGVQTAELPPGKPLRE